MGELGKIAGAILPGWLKSLVCGVVTFVKWVVLTVPIAATIAYVGYYCVASIVAVCVVAGAVTVGIACIVVVLLWLIFWIAFVYYVIVVWYTKIIKEEIIEKHCTVFD